MSTQLQVTECSGLHTQNSGGVEKISQGRVDEMNKHETIEKVGTPLSYRPDIKVMDCTIRDGGLVNKFFFEDDFVKVIYTALAEAGVDYMEIGYKASDKIFSTNDFGKWRFCKEDDIRRIVGDSPKGPKISVMADAERTEYKTDILEKSQSAIDMIRVATYIHQIPTALEMIKDAHDKGYETTVNLMAVSNVKESELDEALDMLTDSEVEVIYLVDSFGSLYSESIRELSSKYLKYAHKKGKKVGIHTHNNQQLAFANTIEALTLGVSYLDATLFGMGRGAGNCHTEMLLGFLKNPKYHQRPLLKCVQECMLPMKAKSPWGFDIPYMLTGQLNLHPQDAIKFLGGSESTNYIKFYDTIMGDE